MRTSLDNLLKLHDEWTLRQKIRSNLTEWASAVVNRAGLSLSIHHRALLDKLDLVASGDIKRLMIQMPPGSAKSTYASVIFPIWWFVQHPCSSVIATSHTADLVEYFSRRMQLLIEEFRSRIGFGIQVKNSSVSHWQTDTGGEYYAVGVRGSVTGRRADLIIVDDPIKSMNEASSARHRQYLWDWYTSELVTRMKPDARIVFVMTRWHEQDIASKLITGSASDWHLLRLPALAENDDPIGRPAGAPLWPAWEGIDALEKKRVAVGGQAWSALFQQSPRRDGGYVFNTSLIEIIDNDMLSTVVKSVRAWDLAATDASSGGDPDWTVGLKLSLYQNGRKVVDDVVRARANHRSVQEMIVSTAANDGHSVVISIPVDPGQAGKYQAAQLASLLSGYRIYTSRETGSKKTRASVAGAQIDSCNLAIQNARWNGPFLEELAEFPLGAKDDQVDALSRAFATLAALSNGSRRLSLPFTVR